MTKSEQIIYDTKLEQRFGSDVDGMIKQILYRLLEDTRPISLSILQQKVYEESLGIENFDTYDEVDYVFKVLGDKAISYIGATAAAFMVEQGDEDKVNKIFEREIVKDGKTNSSD